MKRFILLLIIVAGIGIGIFVLTSEKESSPAPQDAKPQSNEPAGAEFFEPSEILAKTIIKGALDARFNAETATYKVANLDSKGGSELIIGAAGKNIGTIQILTLLNTKGEWERMGKIEYQENQFGTPEVKELTDIDGDGQKEIIMSLMYGGPANVAEGILDVDFTAKTMRWVQLRDEQGELQDAIFLVGSTVSHHNTFQIQDADKDGKEEIVEIFTETQPYFNGTEDVFVPVECTANAYEWNGVLFNFDAALSKQIHDGLGEDCTM